MTRPDGNGRLRVRSTLSVELAVENVVVGAAGAAHGDRADQKQNEMPEVRASMEGEAGERRRLPARGEQQLPSGRPIETRELNERKGEIRSQPQDQARRPRVRQAAPPAAARRSKRSGGQRLSLRTGAAALRRLLLHLLHLRRDLARLGVELRRSWRDAP